VTEEGGSRPLTALEPVTLEQVPASSVELVEPASAPSSSRAVEKAPTLPKDASLALRRAKSVVMKDDMDEYAKLNTDVVKKALAHSLMKVGFSFLCESVLIYLIQKIIFVFLCKV
jgi:hypothetical protein